MHELKPAEDESFFDGTRWTPMASDPLSAPTTRPGWRRALTWLLRSGMLGRIGFAIIWEMICVPIFAAEWASGIPTTARIVMIGFMLAGLLPLLPGGRVIIIRR